MLKHRAFTLIELLVVIAIIAILAAILFPVYATVREKGRQTACLSNMKQLGLAFASYRQDYNEKNPGTGEGGCGVYQSDNYLPFWVRGKAPSGSHWVPCVYGHIRDWWAPHLDPTVNPEWFAAGGPTKGGLYPYVKNAKIFICPSDRKPKNLLSYSMHLAAGWASDKDISRSSQFLLLVDEHRSLNDGAFHPPMPDLSPADCPSDSHNGGANIVFWDSHAKWYRADDNPAWGACKVKIPPSIFCWSIPIKVSESERYANYCQTE